MPRFLKLILFFITVSLMLIEVTKAEITSESDSPIDLLIDNSVTFTIQAGGKPLMVYKLRIYFAPDYGKRFSLYTFLKEVNKAEKVKIVFPLCLQDTDIDEKVIIKGYTGVPFNITSLESDKLELEREIEIKISNSKVIQSGTSRSHYLDVHGGRMIAYSRKSAAKGSKLYRIGPPPGEEGLVIGEDISAVEEYTLNNPHKVASYIPNVFPTQDSIIPLECDSDGIPIRAVPNAVGVTWVFEKAGDTIVVSFKGYREIYKAEKDGATIKFTKKGPILNGIVKSIEEIK